MLKLLKDRSFGSLVLSQFLGAFNDNAFKQLILLLTVGAATAGAIPWVQESGLAVDASGVNRQELPATLFALPFVVLCLVTGALADRFSKSTIIKVANVLEVVVMAMGLLAIYLESYLGLLLVVGCMGAQSALFGPSKYGILKELLDERDMSRANALIQTTTTVAILGGVVVAGELLDRFPDQLWLPGLAYVGIAVAGLAASLAIRHEPARVPEREIPWNLPAEFVRHWKALRGHPTLAVSIAGSAFYYLVASLLVLVVNEYGLIELGLSSAATSRLMLPVIVGIGLGAVVGGKLSGDRVEGGLVPLGLFGMTGALLAIQFAPANLLWVQGCLGFLGLSSGVFSLPIRTLVQVLPAEEDRGSVLGFSQVLDFAGILLAAPCLLLLKAMSLTPPQMMVAIAILILLGFAVSLRFAAHFTVRLAAWIFAHTVYRTRLIGAEHLPKSGGALLVANHVSFVDAVLVAASSDRPVRFLMYRGFFKVPLLGWFARKMEAIPVSSQDSKSEKVAALSAAADAAARGELVCIFAEGGLTRSGHLMSFAAGLERIAREARVPILPVALDRLWGSIFSHEGGKVFWKLPRRLPFKVDVSIGAPMSPDASAFQVRQRIAEQVAELRTERQGRRGSLAWRFLKEARANAGRPAVLDSTGVDLNYRKLLVGALCMRDALRPHLGEARSVAVLMPPGAGGALVNLALALDGRTSVNLNYTMSNGDLAAMCETAGAEHMITARRFLSGLERPSPLGDDQTILLEEIRGDITTAMKLRYLGLSFLPGVLLANLLAPRSPSGEPESEEVATVIFSSGSTGVPKGVMLTHSNVLSNVQSVLEVIALGPGDGVLGILPFFHSFGYTITLWATFLSGARGVYHVNPLEAKVVGELSQKGGVTITIATPTFYQSYLRRCTKEQFAGIRVALSGAQKLNQGLADAWKAKFGSELMEGYGCTEAAPVVSANLPGGDHLPPRQRGHREGSIGRPIPGVAVKIVDPDVYPAEVIEREGGESGLILVKGPNVMKGYIGMPEKTAEVLRDGWYTTGDIGHIDRDGFLFITDRLSRFSKIGGEMVPHGRVEEVIGDLMFELLGPSSKEAEEDGVVPELAVTAVEHETKGERLIVLHTPMPFELEELKARLAGSDLPALFRPAPNAWVEVPELPKLGTGKLDLRGLSNLAQELVGTA